MDFKINSDIKMCGSVWPTNSSHVLFKEPDNAAFLVVSDGNC